MNHTSQFTRLFTEMIKEGATSTVEGILAYQWKGDNFKEISDALSENLSGYVYRKDDDLLIDYNDGYSIKRVKPLAWILINSSEENDITIMSDQMLELMKSCMKDYVDLGGKPAASENTKKEDSDLNDQGVDIAGETRYGDKIKLRSVSSGYMSLQFRSYQGDNLNICHDPVNKETSIELGDRYGNKLSAKGSKLVSNAVSSKTSAQLYDTVHMLVDKLQTKTLDLIDRVNNCVDNSKKVAG